MQSAQHTKRVLVQIHAHDVALAYGQRVGALDTRHEVSQRKRDQAVDGAPRQLRRLEAPDTVHVDHELVDPGDAEGEACLH